MFVFINEPDLRLVGIMHFYNSNIHCNPAVSAQDIPYWVQATEPPSAPSADPTWDGVSKEGRVVPGLILNKSVLIRKEQKPFVHAGELTLNLAASCTHEPNEICRLMPVSAGWLMLSGLHPAYLKCLSSPVGSLPPPGVPHCDHKTA